MRPSLGFSPPHTRHAIKSNLFSKTNAFLRSSGTQTNECPWLWLQKTGDSHLHLQRKIGLLKGKKSLERERERGQVTVKVLPQCFSTSQLHMYVLYCQLTAPSFDTLSSKTMKKTT